MQLVEPLIVLKNIICPLKSLSAKHLGLRGAERMSASFRFHITLFLKIWFNSNFRVNIQYTWNCVTVRYIEFQWMFNTYAFG